MRWKVVVKKPRHTVADVVSKHTHVRGTLFHRKDFHVRFSIQHTVYVVSHKATSGSESVAEVSIAEKVRWTVCSARTRKFGSNLHAYKSAPVQ